MNAPVPEISGLRVAFGRGSATREVVHGVDLAVRAGEKLGIVGESGSGKTVTALAAMGLLGRAGRITAGSVRLEGREIVGLDERAFRALRGSALAMIFQDPMTALNPAFTVGRQITDVLDAHLRPGAGSSRAEAERLLEQVGIGEARQRLKLYPHELSGGMRQRVLIAMAIACRPRVLFADEPTTALDVTVQAQVVALLRDLCDRLGIALVFISHNLDLVAELCDDIIVMRHGAIVERGSAETIFRTPRDPYTRLLLDAVPRLPASARANGPAPAA